MEEISFNASTQEPGAKVTITQELVKDRVGDLLVRSDMSKYIL